MFLSVRKIARSALEGFRVWNRKRLTALRSRRYQRRCKAFTDFGAFAHAICARTTHGFFLVDPKDTFVSSKLLKEGRYSDDELTLVSSLINPDSICVVLGPHVGSIAIPLARLCRKLYAFEANPDTFELLQLNLLLNKSTNVTVENIAVAEHNGELVFLKNFENTGASRRMPIARPEGYFYDDPEEVVVQCKRLDNLVSERNIDLMFADIEGSEYFAFLGGASTLQRTTTLVTELVPSHLRNVAGVGAEAFWATLEPYFDVMTIPSLRERIDGAEAIEKKLRIIFESNNCFDNVVFSRSSSGGSLL